MQTARAFVASGGLDQVTPSLTIPQGRVRSAVNVEVLAEGYSLCEGYERFDGRPAPSSASVVDPEATVDELRELTEAAQTLLRNAIGTVPGAGPVRGVAELNGSIYAWRDTADGSQCRVWKASSSGWAEIAVTRLLRFESGLIEFADGDAIEGATSGATAIAARVIKDQGDWGTTASGYVILDTLVGSFESEQIEVGGIPVASVSQPVEEVRFPVGGRYVLFRHNFFGNPSTFRLYGANGVGPAFEFDGRLVTPIYTGTVPETPYLAAEHANHLVLGFNGGSVQLSSDPSPYLFDAVQGAAEFAIGTDLTDMQSASETALVIFGRQKVGILTGTDIDTYVFETLTEESGAEAWTVQKPGQTIFLDRRGLRTLSATAAFGNFRAGALTVLVDPFITAARKSGATPIASCLVRGKSQYRIFWNNGVGLSVYVGRKDPEVMPFDTGSMRVSCIGTCEMADGSEGVFAGAEDGYVYRLDSGTTFDGADLLGFVMFPFNHLGSTGTNKRYHSVEMDMDIDPGSEVSIIAHYDDSNGEIPSDAQGAVTGLGGGGIWNASFWSEFYWNAAYHGTISSHIDGIGKNISVTCALRSNVLNRSPVLKSYTIFYRPVGLKKERIK